MHLQHVKRLDDWLKLHKEYPEQSAMKKAVAGFKAKAGAADWHSEADVRATFADADCSAAPLVGFPIAGRYRITADVDLSSDQSMGYIEVRWVGLSNTNVSVTL